MLEVAVERFAYAGAGRDVLRQVSLRVEPGELVGLCGAAEAGKSTLCYLLSGFIPHYFRGALRGDVRFEGRSCADVPHAEWLAQVGVVFQNPFTQLTGARFTVREEVAFALENAGWDRPRMQDAVARMLAELGLEGVAERSPYALSGGQQQMVALASILVFEPRVLVLDEPTAQLDPQAAAHVFAVLRRVSVAGTSVIVVEHDAGLLAEHAGRVIALEDGRIARDADPRAVYAGLDPLPRGIRRPPVTELAAWTREVGAWPEDIPLPLHAPEAAAAFTKIGTEPIFPPGPEPDSLAMTPRKIGTEPVFSAVVSLDEAPRKMGSVPIFGVEVEGVRFGFTADREVLRGVSLRVGQGERVALLGRNGAGKTTLARHLVGLYTPWSGSVRVMGSDVAGRAGEAARHVGYVFQNPDHQLFTRRAWDEVAFGPRNLGVRGEALREAVGRAIEAVGLEGAVDANPRDLDYGMRKRLALASVLAMRTPVLVLDEPSGNLDAVERERLIRILDDLTREGRTLVVITHDMELCANHFPRVIAMAEGRVLADGPAAGILGDASVRDAAGLLPPASVAVAECLGSTIATDGPATREAFLRAICRD